MSAFTILAADDEQGCLSLMDDWLEPEGCRVLKAASGPEALRRIEEHNPDLVLLDAKMPSPDGFEVCRHVKNHPQYRLIPVVIITALQAQEDRIRSIEAGADDFLTKPLNRRELLARIRSLLRMKKLTDGLEEAEPMLLALALSVEARDPYTKGHCGRISAYSVALGRQLGLPEEDLEALRRGGILHDLGKIAVPDSILNKAASLTAEERRILEQHPVRGYEICKSLRSFRDVLPIIRHHHEKFDGSGYPDGLRGEEIPLTARVLQIVDVYDALTTARPYKPALMPSRALQQMRAEVHKGWWDPRIFQAFCELVLYGQSDPVAATDRMSARPASEPCLFLAQPA